MGSGGDGFFDRILNSSANSILSLATLGNFKLDEEGKVRGTDPFNQAFGFRSVVDQAEGTIKAVTGADQAEEANELAREQFEESKINALKAREDAVARNAANQLSASRGASGSRRSSASSGRSSNNSRFTNLGNDERDFLGL